MPSSRRRKAPIGVSRSAVRVARSRIVSARAGEALGLGQAQRVGHRGVRPSVARRLGSRRRPRIKKRPSSHRDERSCLPRCHPRSAVCRTLTDGPSGCRHPIDRSALPCIAGALRRSLLVVRGWRRLAFGPVAPGSIRRRRHPGSHQPPGLWNGARRVLVPIKARLRDVARSLGAAIRGASSRGPRRSRRAGAGSAAATRARRGPGGRRRPRRSGPGPTARAPAPATRTRRTPPPSRRRRPRCCRSWCRRPPARG